MRFICCLLACLAVPVALNAQIVAPTPFTPNDVWVVVNSNMIASVALGEFYCQQRKVPLDHLIKLDLPETEEMKREEYETKLLAPLREKLGKLEQTDFILLTTYGVPIRVGSAQPKPDDASKLDVIKRELKKLHDDLHETNETIRKLTEAGDSSKARLYQVDVARLQQSIAKLSEQEGRFNMNESYAAVDSELSMMWFREYPLAKWQFNLRYFTVAESARSKLPKIVMTCRVDGPTPAVAKRIIEDAIKAEAAGGPEGFAYVDARGIQWDKKDIVAGSYGGFDESLRELAKLFKALGFRTVLDNAEEVFAAGACPRAAMYYGWYALENYSPSLELMTGSIAIHAASFEAVSLRKKDKARWVPSLLLEGACVTVGPVAEPYLIAFPKPATFFGFLLAGHTVVESYWLSNPMTSWQMMVIGDPLYRPFGSKPKMASKDVKLSPEGSQFPPRAR